MELSYRPEIKLNEKRIATICFARVVVFGVLAAFFFIAILSNFFSLKAQTGSSGPVEHLYDLCNMFLRIYAFITLTDACTNLLNVYLYAKR